VEAVINEMLRVGRTGIVSFPNFAYHKLRRMLAEHGRAPRSAGVLHYEWYDTPNIRFLTIADSTTSAAARTSMCTGGLPWIRRPGLKFRRIRISTPTWPSL